MTKKIRICTVPNQRIIRVHKEKGSKQNLYTTNVLNNLNEAMQNLKNKASFKLYMYLAQNQNDYEMALSSSDFFEVSSCENTAYTTAFKELVEKGYLIQNELQKNVYDFYDKSQTLEQQEEEDIEIPEREIIEITITQEDLYKGFKF